MLIQPVEYPFQTINYAIKPEKEKAWHNYIHPYFTKQASNVVRAYIEHYSRKGDLVLDPFGGTGVTAIEALTLRRRVILVDINPLACFIAEQTVKNIDTEKLRSAFSSIAQKIEKQMLEIQAMGNAGLKNQDIPYWYPRNIPMPSNSDFRFVEELWTPRQLLSLSILYNEIQQIEQEDVRNQLKLVFSATIARVNLSYNLSMSRQEKGKNIKLGDGGSSIFAQYRYWKPRQLTELPVWERFTDRFKRVLKAKENWNGILKGYPVDENFKIINGSVLNLENYIGEKSIDYIYTDPPYGGNIAYLDLSTMWNAWLGFDVNNEMKSSEIIEGGELRKSEENYTELFSKSFHQMSKVLKDDKWLSCVFAHKKLEFWNVIVESCEETGLELKGSVYQPTNNSSIHYKKNKANVLCSQRIVNFRKTNVKSVKQKPDDLKEYIIREMQLACSTNGAPVDMIYQKVLDQLLHNNTLSEAKKKGFLKLEKFLSDEEFFYFNDDTKLYYVNEPEVVYENHYAEFLKKKDEIRIFITEILNKHGAASFDQVFREIFDIYAREKTFPINKSDVNDILDEIGTNNKISGKWSLKQYAGEQVKIDFSKPVLRKLIPVKSSAQSHSEIIFRLVKLGHLLGYHCWIGKREQSVDSFQGYAFSDLSMNKLSVEGTENSIIEKIRQIDVIWLDNSNKMKYAFEVEESTSMLSGLERFRYLLEIEPAIAEKLFIVSPRSRMKKLRDTFTRSSYIGHPMYMENKVHVIFKDDLCNFYDLRIDKEFSESELKIIIEKIGN